MSHLVPAIGAAALAAAGNVWWVPALVDLRAGDDRPHSARPAALGCLAWWLGTALTAMLWLTPAPGRLGLAVLAAAAVTGGALRLAAVPRREAELREAARTWAAVAPATVPRPARRGGPRIGRTSP
ncbi:hypothetical protein [Kitasatospora sp. DSM 101779]|uniref:hypothetical protein n=1 Tax=Kitasatospora sp. DSM 101779 TaxID=2853165 RepID=UPI0021DA14E4|nr:hypothetical protein [Kitasatospora sp. DSM 101779]MCU7823810.1 hypothetical protein [Kitasatospora sp. DSM 101779]